MKLLLYLLIASLGAINASFAMESEFSVLYRDAELGNLDTLKKNLANIDLQEKVGDISTVGDLIFVAALKSHPIGIRPLSKKRIEVLQYLLDNKIGSMRTVIKQLQTLRATSQAMLDEVAKIRERQKGYYQAYSIAAQVHNKRVLDKEEEEIKNLNSNAELMQDAINIIEAKYPELKQTK